MRMPEAATAAGEARGQGGEMVEVVRTRDGRPAVWERGGGASSTGRAVIVAAGDGSPKPAAYVPRGGHLSNGEHALIPVVDGDVIVSAHQWRGDFTVLLQRVVSEGLSEPFAEFRQGVWSFTDGTAPVAVPDGESLSAALAGTSAAVYTSAVRAAAQKSLCYHCREAHYVAQPRHVDMGAR